MKKTRTPTTSAVTPTADPTKDDTKRIPDQETKQPRPTTSLRMALDDIIERTNYTRDLCPEHVDMLAASIAAVGLEHPLVLLTNNHLVAGRHRLHALKTLRGQHPNVFAAQFPDGCVPVQVFDLGEDPDHEAVLALETTENAARKNYTYKEIARVITVLRAKGYTEKSGRPKAGERPVGPVLCRVFGLSPVTIARARATARRAESLSGDRVSKPDLDLQKASEPGGEVGDGAMPPQSDGRGTYDQDANGAVSSPLLAAAKKVADRLDMEDLQVLSAWIQDKLRQAA